VSVLCIDFIVTFEFLFFGAVIVSRSMTLQMSVPVSLSIVRTENVPFLRRSDAKIQIHFTTQLSRNIHHFNLAN